MLQPQIRQNATDPVVFQGIFLVQLEFYCSADVLFF